MARIQVVDFAVDASGNTLSGAQVEVRDGDGSLVTLYEAATGTTEAYSGSNPFSAGDGSPDKVGYFSFFIENSIDELQISVGTGGSQVTYPFYPNIQRTTSGERVVKFLDASTFLADSTSYPEGTIAKTLKGGFSYERVASSGNITSIKAGSQEWSALGGSDGSVSIEQFGWTSGDIATSFTSALESGFKHIRLSGTMTLASEINESVTDLRLSFDPGSTITYTGTAGANRMIELTGVNTLIVDGQVTLDADLKAACGLFVRAADGAELVEIEGVVGVDMFQTSPATYPSTVVHVQCDSGQGKIGIINKCRAENLSRDVSGGVTSAFTLTDFENKWVTGCYIDGVHTGTGTTDADGIKVFDELDTTYSTGNTLVSGNVIANCEGRFVKLQTKGKGAVRDNIFRITEALALITSHRSVDAQVDGADIVDNVFEATTAWTGGADAILFYLRAPDSAPDYTGQMIKGSVKGNKVSVPAAAPDLSRVVYFDLNAMSSRAYTVHFSAQDNFATTDAGWGGGICGAFGITVKVPTTFTSGATAHVKIEGNAWETTAFIERLTASGGTAAHGGTGDLTNKLFLTVRGNSNPSASNLALLPYNSNDCFTSSIVVENNHVGAQACWWQAPFDFAELLSGEFYLAGSVTPAHANTPSSYTFSTVRRKGAYLEVFKAGGVGYTHSWDLISIGSAPSWNSSNFTQNPTGGVTGGSGSAGSGNQYVTLTVNGTSYKVLHDGTV